MPRHERSSLGSYERKLRYRKLLENVEALDDTAVNNIDSIQKAQHVVEEAEKLLHDGELQERVEHPSEGLLDSRVLLASSNMMTRLANGVSGNINVYDPDELALHIKMNPDFWSVIPLPKRISCNMMYLHGTFVPGPPAERPQRVRRQVERQTKHPVKEPENLTNVEKTEESFEMVQRIKKFIFKHYKTNNMKPICFFNLVLDPRSFGKTIENIYHVSFLVRDGLVSISIDNETQLPYISPVSKEDRERANSDNQSENNQFIFSLDMYEWQEAVNAFKITEPLMKIKEK